jgi:hypothetical protein
VAGIERVGRDDKGGPLLGTGEIGERERHENDIAASIGCRRRHRRDCSRSRKRTQPV